MPSRSEEAHADQLPCRILDLTINSVRLEADQIDLPDGYVVVMKLSTHVRRFCKVVWRVGYQAGVRFELRPTDSPPRISDRLTARVAATLSFSFCNRLKCAPKGNLFILGACLEGRRTIATARPPGDALSSVARRLHQSQRVNATGSAL